MTTKMYTPEDVYNFVVDENENDLIIALNQGDDNSKKLEYRDCHTFAAIHRAAALGHINCLKILIEKGADINMETDNGFTPLQLSVEQGLTDVVSILLNRDDININSKNFEGFTAFQLAALYGESKVIEMFLSRDIDINSKNNTGFAAITMAAQNGYSSIVEMLLKNYNDLDINIKNADGDTAVHTAISRGHFDIAEMILLNRDDFDVNSKTNHGFTVLHVAAQNGFNKLVKMLLSRNADINVKNSYGTTALDVAAYFSHVDTVSILLEKGININHDLAYTHNMYAPSNQDALGNPIECTDCRPMIFDEIDHRRKRAIFDSFIKHYIEYQPYIKSIYTLCYPTGDVQVAKPPIGWTRAEAVRDKYYFDEIFFYLHMHMANVVTRSVKKYSTDITISTSISNDHFVNNNNKTFTLMKVLADRLKEYLKPKKIELCGNFKCYKEGTNVCSRCRSRYYCSVECQKLHWKHHKIICSTSKI